MELFAANGAAFLASEILSCDLHEGPVMVALVDCGLSLRGGPMARALREVIAAVPAARRAKILGLLN
jgi:hypothetical protein